MMSEFSPIFILQGFLFVFMIIICWYIPGLTIVRNIKLTFWNLHAAALLTGFSLWSAITVLFAYIGQRNLTYLYLTLFFLLFFVYKKNFVHSFSLNKKVDVILLFILILGVVTQSSLVFFMNVSIGNNIVTCCGHIPDNHLFLAMTNELVQRFPPFEPGVYGAELKNYHYFSHLMIAEIIRLSHLPLSTTVYQFLPAVLSLLLGLSAIVFGTVLRLNNLYKRWLLFFMYFGADAVFLLVLLLGKSNPFILGSMENGITALYNLPKTFSYIILMTGLIWLILSVQKQKLLFSFITSIILALTIGHKAFTGIFVWSGMLGLFVLFVYRKYWILSIIPFITIFLGYFFQKTMISESGGFFYSGLWRVHDFFAMRELGLSEYLLARNIFISANNWIRVFFIDFVMFFIFILVTFGLKLIGFIQTKNSAQNIPLYMHVFFILGTIPSFILGMFFLHEKAGSITVNFLITIFFIMSFYAALSLAYAFTALKKKTYVFIIIIFVLLSSLRSVSELYNAFIKQMPQSTSFTKKDINLFTYIRDNTSSNSLILPLGYSITYEELYISYVTNRPIYVLGNYGGPEVKKILPHRESVIKKLDSEVSVDVAKKIMLDENINFILIPKQKEYPWLDSTIADRIFSSTCCNLYSVRRTEL